MTTPALLVSMEGITKRFGPVTVLDRARFELRAGEVHVLAGENGAGKSTLIKILGGVHGDYDGRVAVGGRLVRLRSPQEAAAAGVAVIHQELSLIGPMSVADNLFLGGARGRGGWVDEARQRREARGCLARLGLDLDPARAVEEFPLATRQMIEIAKALSRDARVLVMDEPTSALNAPEVARLFELIQTLKGRGCGIVYISHKMEEIERLADRITVLRDGRWIGTAPRAELPPARLIEWMVGREMEAPREAPAMVAGAPRLRLRDFAVWPAGGGARAAVEVPALEVRAGEIVGLAGLQGSGAGDLLAGLGGARGSGTRGGLWLDGAPVRFRGPREAIAAGVALVPNDRKAAGLVLSLSITANATLAGLRALSPGGWRRPGRERAAAEATTGPLRLRAASLDLEAGALSGGNQQKVVLAKWLQIQPRLLLLDDPTRGIDIAAKREIHQLLEEWAARGMAILLGSSELPELLALSHRVLVLHRGRVTGEYTRATARPEVILAAAMGREMAAGGPPPADDHPELGRTLPG